MVDVGRCIKSQHLITVRPAIAIAVIDNLVDSIQEYAVCGRLDILK